MEITPLRITENLQCYLSFMSLKVKTQTNVFSISSLMYVQTHSILKSGNVKLHFSLIKTQKESPRSGQRKVENVVCTFTLVLRYPRTRRRF